MLSKFTLALFTLTLSAFFGSATAQDYYSQLSQEETPGTGLEGDNHLASFLIGANNSDSSQTNFKRSHVMRRRNTPEGGSGKSKGFVVPLRKGVQGTRYVGTIRASEGQYQKTFDVVFGTAAFDLAVVADLPCSIDDKTSRKRPKNRYAEVLRGSVRVNLFDGFGTGVACRDTIEVGGISQKSQTIVTLQKIDGFTPRYIADGIFPLVRTTYTESFFKHAVKDHTIEPVFAFAHRASRDKGLKGQGELHLGIIKDDYISKNRFETHDCVADSLFWMVDKATITVGKYKIKNVRTVFDTASRLVRGPKEEVSKIYDFLEEEMTITEAKNGIYLSSYTSMKRNAPKITFQWGNGIEWEIPPEKFVQGSGSHNEGHNSKGVALFAAHTEFTAALPKTELNELHPVEPPLSPDAMGPPHAEALKPSTNLQKGSLLPPPGANRPLPLPHVQAVMEPQDKKMASDYEVYGLTGSIPQPMPAYTDWIIPYPFMEERYIIFDGRNGGCKVWISTLPPEKLKF